MGYGVYSIGYVYTPAKKSCTEKASNVWRSRFFYGVAPSEYWVFVCQTRTEENYVIMRLLFSG